ncbi:MAG: hypothetical protein AAGF11_42600 [Myxococcota bacterium]
MTALTGRYAAVICLAMAAACHDQTEADAPEPMSESGRNRLVWKRSHALEADLAAALSLPNDALCSELGSLSCVREVHLTSLGGHDPIGQGMYRPLAAPMLTTSLAVERVVTSACARRVELDATGEPEVFDAIDLHADAPQPSSDAHRSTTQTLVRRFLGRDPVSAEYEQLGALVTNPQGTPSSGSAYALASCIAVGTSAEFLFF